MAVFPVFFVASHTKRQHDVSADSVNYKAFTVLLLLRILHRTKGKHYPPKSHASMG